MEQGPVVVREVGGRNAVLLSADVLAAHDGLLEVALRAGPASLEGFIPGSLVGVKRQGQEEQFAQVVAVQQTPHRLATLRLISDPGRADPRGVPVGPLKAIVAQFVEGRPTAFPAHVIDLSAGGVGLVAGRAVPRGAETRIRIEASGDGPDLWLPARVVWSVSAHEQSRLGARFTVVDEEQLDPLLQRFVLSETQLLAVLRGRRLSRRAAA